MRRSLLSKKSAWRGIACLDLLGAPSSFFSGIQRFTLHSNRGRLSSTWDPSPRVRCFHYPVASLCFSSNAPFKSAGILTNEQRCEQGGWGGRGVGARTAPHTHTHTPCPIHSGPSRSGAPLLTDTLSSCTVSPGLPQSQTSTPHVKHALADAYGRTNMTRKLKE